MTDGAPGGVRPSDGDPHPDDAQQEHEERVLRCRDCESPIADPADVFSPDGGPPLRVHANPHGVLWEVLTVRQARGVVVRGPPTTAFSWFVGTAWRMLSCATCGQHLGWRYDTPDGDGFFGLVRPHLVG